VGVVQKVAGKSGPSPGFRNRGGKDQKGGHIFNYNIGCMQQPEGQT